MNNLNYVFIEHPHCLTRYVESYSGFVNSLPLTFSDNIIDINTKYYFLFVMYFNKDLYFVHHIGTIIKCTAVQTKSKTKTF